MAGVASCRTLCALYKDAVPMLNVFWRKTLKIKYHKIPIPETWFWLACTYQSDCWLRQSSWKVMLVMHLQKTLKSVLGQVETPTYLRDLQQCLTQHAIMSQEVNNTWDCLGQHLYYRNDPASMSRWISARATIKTYKTPTIHTPSSCTTTHHLIQCVDLCAATWCHTPNC